MGKYTIQLDRKSCIGCGACIVACPNFVSDEDKAKVLKETIDQEEYKQNKEAEDVCPVKCISITKQEENSE